MFSTGVTNENLDGQLEEIIPQAPSPNVSMFAQKIDTTINERGHTRVESEERQDPQKNKKNRTEVGAAHALTPANKNYTVELPRWAFLNPYSTGVQGPAPAHVNRLIDHGRTPVR